MAEQVKPGVLKTGALKRCEAILIKIVKLSPIILAIAVVIYIIYYLIKGIYFMIEHKKRINNNWPTYRCKPYVMPFAGWFVGPGSTNPATNFVECSFSMHKSFYDVLKQDFMKMFGSLSDIVKDQQVAIQDARKMTNYMRESIKHFAQDIYQKMYDAFYRISSLFSVFMGAFGKLFKLFSDTYNVLLYAYYTLESTWNGPIGFTARALSDIAEPIVDVVHFFCFSPDTPILMADLTYKRAHQIQLGDTLGMKSGTVTSCMELDGTGAEMYIYRDCITVSGTHLVYSPDEGWVRVHNSIHAHPVKWDDRSIYCFNTTNNRIPAGSYLFADYMETNNDAIVSCIQAATLHELNTGGTITLDSLISSVRIQYSWALCGDTMIDLLGTGYKPISDLKLGDKLALGGTVKGLIRISPIDVMLYRYLDDTLSGSQLVYEDGKWLEVRDSSLSERIPTSTSELYHIATNNGVMRLHSGVKTTDFLQSTSEKQSDMIDQYVQTTCYST